MEISEIHVGMFCSKVASSSEIAGRWCLWIVKNTAVS